MTSSGTPGARGRMSDRNTAEPAPRLPQEAPMSIALIHGPVSRPAVAPAVAVPRSAAQPPLRLTRRGRIVVGTLVSLALALGVVVFGSSVAATDDLAGIGT